MNRIVQYTFSQHLYSFNTEGWFNATEAAARFGKRLDEAITGGPSQILDPRNSGYVKTSRARADRGGGTWLHPKLAVRFAGWLDERFAVWCDLQIDTIIRGGIQAQGNANLLPLFLRSDAAPWERRFPPGYYAALAKLTGTRYEGHALGTPALFGQLTDRWVYACILPEDVHAELKARRDKSCKMHQWRRAGNAGQANHHRARARPRPRATCATFKAA